MNYIKRGLEEKFLCINSFFKAVLVTGARQVGKTTMLKHLAENEETLAGRLGILELYSLSQREQKGIFYKDDLEFSLPALLERQKTGYKSDILDVYQHIWRGGMPQSIYADEEMRQIYYDSYIDTYLMRDVAELGGITDTIRFHKFLVACAALTAEQLNYKILLKLLKFHNQLQKNGCIC